MKITILGSGTSTGVPEIGCTCPVCQSPDPRDHRLRASALVETDDTRLLIDCGPDFREQMLRVPFGPIDGVLITHEHYDHTGGIDDLRPFTRHGDVPIYLDHYTYCHLHDRLPYFFRDKLYPGVAVLQFHEVQPYVPFQVHGLHVQPLQVMHGQLPILGYRIGPLGYITDMSAAPEATLQALRGVEVLIVNALRYTPHHSHQTVDAAIAFARAVGAPRTYFIHMSHQIGLHAEAQTHLPAGMYFAYDGLQIQV